MRWPLLFVPVKASHVLLFTIPVEVEYYAVNRIALCLEGVDDATSFGLCALAVFGGDISKRPERGHFLTACQCAKFADSAFERACAIYEIV